MEAIFGCTVCGQKTVIYRGFEYWRKRDNVNGTTAWRCREFQHFQCKASLLTSGSRIVSNRLPDHTHEGNVATALARKAVGEMKDRMTEVLATPSSSQASVASSLDNHVQMALPRRSAVTRTLQRRRQRAIAGD